ncbi:hypothetical protein N781_16985 [Pontibacillus halophilus JSM 076056 = DSM 19796]|uniref:Uncharacterized protein n=1 Tax=Pontibacillus halophilus JSM 076056 = DSM 19796 TaxID=1385510 RepID=A0A0A5I9N0_9BACI|nr:hypothetical protein [Pontibacillus halophilus]KGX92517.1 hypothetical protein N781_16985 [Pontibacillus halophilus JSM 076056 = DSM 19796]
MNYEDLNRIYRKKKVRPVKKRSQTEEAIENFQKIREAKQRLKGLGCCRAKR